jgi:hypothetical protein
MSMMAVMCCSFRRISGAAVSDRPPLIARLHDGFNLAGPQNPFFAVFSPRQVPNAQAQVCGGHPGNNSMHRIFSDHLPARRARAIRFAALRAGGRDLAAAIALTLAAFFLAGKARAQSFECASAATPAELAICNSEQLLVLDEKLSAMVARRETKASNPILRQVVSDDQAEWARLRNECGVDEACLITRYTMRISELADPSPVSSMLSFADEQ